MVPTGAVPTGAEDVTDTKELTNIDRAFPVLDKSPSPPTVIKIQVAQFLPWMENLHGHSDVDDERTKRRREHCLVDTRVIHVWTIPADVFWSFADGVTFTAFIQLGERCIMPNEDYYRAIHESIKITSRAVLIAANAIDATTDRHAAEDIYRRMERYHDFYVIKEGELSDEVQRRVEQIPSSAFDGQFCDFVKQDFLDMMTGRYYDSRRL